MKKILVFLMFSVTLTTLTGCYCQCEKKEKKEVRTVSFYKAHEKERRALIEVCRDNPGELEHDANCVNAIDADNRAESGKKGTLDFDVLDVKDLFPKKKR